MNPRSEDKFASSPDYAGGKFAGNRKQSSLLSAASRTLLSIHVSGLKLELRRSCGPCLVKAAKSPEHFSKHARMTTALLQYGCWSWFLLSQIYCALYVYVFGCNMLLELASFPSILDN